MPMNGCVCVYVGTHAFVFFPYVINRNTQDIVCVKPAIEESNVVRLDGDIYYDKRRITGR